MTYVQFDRRTKWSRIKWTSCIMIDFAPSYWYTVVYILIDYINLNICLLKIVGLIAISIISTFSTKFLSVFTFSYIIMHITNINKFVYQFVCYSIISFLIFVDHFVHFCILNCKIFKKAVLLCTLPYISLYNKAYHLARFCIFICT